MVIALHGGAGTLERRRMSPERERAYRDALRECLGAGRVRVSIY